MKVLITGGAGYIGSLLTGVLLNAGHHVTVVDCLLFGGDSILPYFAHPRFAFEKLDVCTGDLAGSMNGADAVVHLAALVGFPACQQVGEAAAMRFNVEATRRVFEAAEAGRVQRFLLASTYSNYGRAADDQPVTEDSPLYPQSLYARTKIAAEEYLLERGRTARCAPVIPRFTTLFGVSPRTRFDLLVNQFVLEALTDRRLVLYEGNYRRSFVHVRDVVEALCLLLQAPIPAVRNQVFNVGSEEGNYSKAEIAGLVCKAVADVAIEQRNLSFGGDMRDVTVSCRKIQARVGFRVRISVEEGIREVRDALQSGLIHEPRSARYRNHTFIVQ
ncbi:MAG: NAD(P)-dependent oxidoreductase [Candidatus Rokubacteria bacterium]|nr:NAD(P)-dependent oxidoreductase [Candidatus Rokubacteria bacterium]